ncbi:MAG: dihydroorotate dehydrogenase electron transfer subunit [Ruminococcaceae bacterium]|nr:dihydroorotate dehydrogenase electron transfer subunit [Oscillospiraceae bacterium]
MRIVSAPNLKKGVTTLKQTIFTIKEQKKLTSNVYEMTLLGDTDGIACGQFVNIKLDGFFLRRPISVCDCKEGELTIIYKVIGTGTEYMAGLENGKELDILTGLGNGYSLSESGDCPVLLGGGVGVPPMYMLAKELVAAGKKVSVILGFNTKDEVFYEKEFKALGASVTVTTVDGSYGVKGFVTDALKNMDYTYTYCCGPEPMLKAVYNTSVTSGQYSFEERMGCGFGACMGCSCKTLYGNKRICKDGPVLVKEEIIFN